MTLQNSKATIWYGLHMYPGVCEYRPKDKEMFRVFLNEDTLRQMDPSFAGKPFFIMHVDDVEKNLTRLKDDCDGWVVRSFYNEADGKHWAQFVSASEKADELIASGWQLSNAYDADDLGPGGEWNAVAYQRQVMTARYQHLALVPDPRYEESIILSPEEFKQYNEAKLSELLRLQNNKESPPMLKLFNRKSVETDKAKELENLVVILPKSGREVDITRLVNEADEAEEKKKEPQMAHGEHLVAIDGKNCTVNELVAKHKALCDALDAFKKNDMDSDTDTTMNEADKEAAAKKEKDEKEKETTKNAKDAKDAEDKAAADKVEADKAEALKIQNAKDKTAADALRSARENAAKIQNETVLETMTDRVARGRARYG